MTLEDADAEAQYLASTLGNQTIPKKDAISIGVYLSSLLLSQWESESNEIKYV